MPKRTPPPPRADADEDDGTDMELREVQQYMAHAQTIADGGNPHFRIGPARTKAANKVSIIAGLLACQPETRNDGIGRMLDYHSQGNGELWVSGGSVETLTTSHEHIHLAGMALHLWALRDDRDSSRELRSASPLYESVRDAWRLWTAAVRLCTFRDERGRMVTLHAGARGRDRRGKSLQEFPTNSCAGKVAEGLLTGKWRKASDRYDVAVPLLQQCLDAGVPREDLLGTDYSPLTARFGYSVLTGPWGFYSYFSRFEGSTALYGAGRVNSETVLAWTQDEAVAIAAKIGRDEA